MTMLPEDLCGLHGALVPVVLCSLMAMCLGYDMGMMSGAVGPIVHQFNLNHWEQGVSVGCLNVVAAVGSLLGSSVIDRYGRVSGITLTAALLVVGPLIVSTSQHFVGLLVGRLITGAGCGLAFVTGPIYASELAPPRHRGAFVAIFEVLSNVGVLLGYLGAMVMNTPGIGKNTGWRIAAALAAAPSVITLLHASSLRESPRWLLQVGRREEAMQIMTEMHASADIEDSVDALKSVEASMKAECAHASWRDIFLPKAGVLRMLVAGIGCAVYQQMCGNDVIVYNTKRVLINFGLTELGPRNIATVAIGMVPIVGSIVGGLGFDRLGRRSLMLGSTCGAFLTLFGLWGLAHFGIESPMGGTVLLGLFVFSVDLGLSPGILVLGTESYPVAIRAKALALGLFINRMLSGLITFAFPVLWDAIGYRGILALFTLVSATGVGWAWLSVPETAGLTLEQAAELYERSSPSLENERRPNEDEEEDALSLNGSQTSSLTEGAAPLSC